MPGLYAWSGRSLVREPVYRHRFSAPARVELDVDRPGGYGR